MYPCSCCRCCAVQSAVPSKRHNIINERQTSSNGPSFAAWMCMSWHQTLFVIVVYWNIQPFNFQLSNSIRSNCDNFTTNQIQLTGQRVLTYNTALLFIKQSNRLSCNLIRHVDFATKCIIERGERDRSRSISTVFASTLLTFLITSFTLVLSAK